MSGSMYGLYGLGARAPASSSAHTDPATESFAYLPCPLPCTDPAAESFAYPVSFDVRDLITLEDVMEELQLGPNG